MRLLRTICYTIILLGSSLFLVFILGMFTSMPDGTYANPEIVENPLAHREYPMTWLTYLALGADQLTRSWAQEIGVVPFDLLAYGFAVPLLTTMVVGWGIARYSVPLWLLVLPTLMAAYGGWIFIGNMIYMGAPWMYDLCIKVLAVLSETVHIPYYDLVALLFLVIPGLVGATALLKTVVSKR